LSENTTIQGNWPEGLKNADLDSDIGKRIGDQSRFAWARFPAAICLRELGRLDEALQSAQQAYTMAEQIGENRLRIWASSMLAFIHGDLGETAVAVDFADEAIAQADEIGQVALQCWSRYARIYLYLLQGDWQSASEMCAQGRRLYEAGDNQLSRIYIGLVAPQIYLGAGLLQEAEASLAELLTLTAAAQTAHYEGVGMRMQGQLFAAQKNWAEAQGAFGQAVARFESLGSQLELGHTLYFSGRMQLERGQPGEARASWQHALEIFASSSARPWSERTREALDGLAPAS
jgi:tetratricopeptide (TPR) repeat protein